MEGELDAADMLMKSLDHLVRYMKRQEDKTLESTSENMPAVKQEGDCSFW